MQSRKRSCFISAANRLALSSDFARSFRALRITSATKTTLPPKTAKAATLAPDMVVNPSPPPGSIQLTPEMTVVRTSAVSPARVHPKPRKPGLQERR